MRFTTITGDDWKRELKAARSTPNSISTQIKMKLNPENPTPGELKTTPRLQSVSTKEVLNAMLLVIEAHKEVIATMAYPSVFSYDHIRDCAEKTAKAEAMVESLISRL